MNKLEFLSELREALRGLPESDIEERLSFYSEMIDDRMEEGLSLEEAIHDIGTVEQIKEEILRTTPLIKLITGKIKRRRKMSATEITALALGSPIWLALAISAFAVILSLYASAWAVVVSLWAAELSFAVCAPAGIISFIVLLFMDNTPAALFTLACGLLCAGLAILSFFGVKYITKATLLLTKLIVLKIKKLFIKGEV